MKMDMGENTEFSGDFHSKVSEPSVIGSNSVPAEIICSHLCSVCATTYIYGEIDGTVLVPTVWVLS